MQNENQIKHEVVENDPDTKFLKGIEKLQNELETLKQKIKELNNDDNKRKLLKFDIEDIQKKIDQYFISLEKYITKNDGNSENDAIEDKLQEDIKAFQVNKK